LYSPSYERVVSLETELRRRVYTYEIAEVTKDDVIG